jgi:hypothetical protein
MDDSSRLLRETRMNEWEVALLCTHCIRIRDFVKEMITGRLACCYSTLLEDL